jgi:hypothetical protein
MVPCAQIVLAFAKVETNSILWTDIKVGDCDVICHGIALEKNTTCLHSIYVYNIHLWQELSIIKNMAA